MPVSGNPFASKPRLLEPIFGIVRTPYGMGAPLTGALQRRTGASRTLQKTYLLTQQDIDEFERVAETMIRHAEWAAVRRTRKPDADFFEVQPTGAQEAQFSIGRCATGNYMLLNHRTGAVQISQTLSALIDRLA